MNPIEERDLEIANLKQALESSTAACVEITAAKNNLAKNRTEIKSLRWVANVNKNKIDFARRVVEQSIDLCISDSSLKGEKELELVTLYSTLIDEDEFDLSEDEICSSKSDFLLDAQKNLLERVDLPQQVECLKNLKVKILEAVNTINLVRKSRMDSFSRKDSFGSSSSLKRNNSVQNGRDHSRAKIETQ